MQREMLRYSVKQALPVMAGYFLVSIAFGLVALDQGVNLFVAQLMNLTIYSGTLEFIGLDVLNTPVSYLSVFMVALFVNVRHLFYGLAFVDKYKPFRKMRWFAIFALTDETFSLLSTITIPKQFDENTVVNLISALNLLSWVAGTFIGVILGYILPFETTGVSFAMIALFVVLTIDQVKKNTRYIHIVGSALIAVICAFSIPKDYYLLVSLLLVSVFLIAGRRWIEGENR